MTGSSDWAEGIRIGCGVEENADLLDKYSTFLATKQGEDNLLDYLTKFDHALANLSQEKGEGEEMNAMDSVYIFVNGMSVRTAFSRAYALQYPNQRYTWKNVRTVVDSIKDYKSKSSKDSNVVTGSSDWAISQLLLPSPQEVVCFLPLFLSHFG